MINYKTREVEEYLLNEIGHGITRYNVVSGYLDQNDQVIMAVVPTREYFKVKEGIKEIDNKSFFVVTDSYQMLNGS